jgi:hypothetical protein
LIFHTSLLSLFCDRLWQLCAFSSIKFVLPSTEVSSIFKCSRLDWKIFNVSVFATYKIHDTKLYILFWIRGFGYSRRNVRSFLTHVNNLLFVWFLYWLLELYRQCGIFVFHFIRERVRHKKFIFSAGNEFRAV